MPRANYFDVMAARDPNSVPKRKPNSKENKGQQNASDQSFANLIASLGMAPTYTPGAAKDPHGQSNVPLTAIIKPRDPNVVVNPRPLNQFTSPRDTNVAQPQSGPRWANGVASSYPPGSPRDPAVAGNPVVPLTALYPKDPNVAQPPRVPPDRTPDPRYYQKTADVVGALANNPSLVNALSTPGGTGYATTDMNAAPIANNPKLSANRAPNLSMLYKDAPANPTSGGSTPPKKQWIVPKGAQIPAGYTVVGDDGKGGQIVQKQEGTKDDPKADQAMNQAYLTAGTSVATAAIPTAIEYFTAEAAPAVAEGATVAATEGASAGAAQGAGVVASEAGAAEGGAAAAGSASSYWSGVSAELGILAGLYKMYKDFHNLEAGHRKVKGKMTDQEIAQSQHPDYFKVEKAQEGLFGKENYRKMRDTVSLGHLAWKTIAGSGKDDEQLKRDRIRRALKGNIMDEEFNINLADGTKYQIGVEDKLEGTDRHPYDVDFSQDGASMIVGMVDPLASIVTDADKKGRRDLSGFMTNAIMASTPDNAGMNVRGLYDKLGVDYQTARDTVTKQFEDGKLDEGRRDAYYASLDLVFGVGGPAQ